MKNYRGVAVGLLLFVVAVRPQLSGIVYPFGQGLLLIPALVAIALLLLSPANESGRSELLKEWTLLLPWILCLWSFGSLLWSADAGRGLEESLGILLNLTAFTLVILLWREGKAGARTLMSGLWILLLPVIFRSAYQYYFGLEKLRELIRQMGEAGQNVLNLTGVISKNRIFDGFLNSNMLAGFLAISIPVTLDLTLTSASRRGQAALACLVAGQFWILLLTGSVGGSLAAAAAAVAVLLLRRGMRGRDLLWMGGVGVVFVAGLIMTRGFDLSPGPDNSIIQRIGYMKSGISMAMEKPLIGWGSGSGPGTLMGFVPVGIRPVTDPHNFLIRAWISWGLPGMVILAVFLFMWARKVFRPMFVKGAKRMPAGYIGFVFGGVAFLLHSLMDMDFFVPETALFGWLALGISLAYVFEARKGEAEGEGERGGKGGSPAAPSAVGLKVLGGAALALVIPILIFTQAEFTAFRANRDVEDGRSLQAAERFDEASRLLPFNGHFALEEGRALRIAGQYEKAAPLFERASDLLPYSPYPSWEMGRVALEQGRWEEALSYLDRAYTRYPTSPRIRIDQARAHYELGQYQETIALLQDVERFAIFDPEAMAVAQNALQSPSTTENQKPIQAY